VRQAATLAAPSTSPVASLPTHATRSPPLSPSKQTRDGAASPDADADLELEFEAWAGARCCCVVGRAVRKRAPHSRRTNATAHTLVAMPALTSPLVSARSVASTHAAASTALAASPRAASVRDDVSRSRGSVSDSRCARALLRAVALTVLRAQLTSSAQRGRQSRSRR
jgi:hypothetical protein